jgi:hypothetical protein
VTQQIDVYDHEVDQLIAIQETLMARCGSLRNYGDFEREIKDRYAEAGFVAQVVWRRYSIDGVPQEGALPDVTIVGRTGRHDFDHDRQVHEVTSNLLGIPGQEGVIRTDQGGSFKAFREHGHGH